MKSNVKPITEKEIAELLEAAHKALEAATDSYNAMLRYAAVLQSKKESHPVPRLGEAEPFGFMTQTRSRRRQRRRT